MHSPCFPLRLGSLSRFGRLSAFPDWLQKWSCIDMNLVVFNNPLPDRRMVFENKFYTVHLTQTHTRTPIPIFAHSFSSEPHQHPECLTVPALPHHILLCTMSTTITDTGLVHPTRRSQFLTVQLENHVHTFFPLSLHRGT